METEQVKLEEIRIYCEDALWSERIQRLLHKEIGASWGFAMPIPQNTFRPWLVLVKNPRTGLWFFTWTLEDHFNNMTCPLYKASELYRARPNQDD